MTNSIDRLAPAGFWPRAAAYALDRLLLGACLVWVRLPMLIAALSGAELFSRPVFFRFTLAEIVCWALRAAYFVLLGGFGGATLGKRAMGLRVVTAAGERAGFASLLYRETIGRYLSGILCVGYLISIGDGESRTLHDRICDTRVVSISRVVRTVPPAAPLTLVQTDDPQRDWYKPYRI